MKWGPKVSQRSNTTIRGLLSDGSFTTAIIAFLKGTTVEVLKEGIIAREI